MRPDLLGAVSKPPSLGRAPLTSGGVWRSQIVGDRFGVGIDDTHIKIRGAPVLDEASLDAHQKMIADKLQVRRQWQHSTKCLRAVWVLPGCRESCAHSGSISKVPFDINYVGFRAQCRFLCVVGYIWSRNPAPICLI